MVLWCPGSAQPEASVKLHSFHLMPYRDLPEDFRERYHSVYIDIPPALFEPVPELEQTRARLLVPPMASRNLMWAARDGGGRMCAVAGMPGLNRPSWLGSATLTS